MHRKYLKLKYSTCFVGLVRGKTNFQLKRQRSTTEIIKDNGDHAWPVWVNVFSKKIPLANNFSCMENVKKN